jgi:hypothetical protein
MEEQVGEITHFYDKISVAVVKLGSGLKVGDAVHIKGKSTDFEQTIESMQLNHQNVEGGKRGDEAAVKLNEKAKEGDIVYRKF